MTIACSDALLQMYVDGDMGPVEREIVDFHLKECARCRETVTQYKGLLWDLEHPVPEAAPPELDLLSDRLMTAWEAAQAEPEPEPGDWRDTSLIWTQVVPGVQGALGVAGWVGRGVSKVGLAGLKLLARRLWTGGGRR